MKTNLLLTTVLALLVLLTINTDTFATKHRISVQDYQFTPKYTPNVKLGDTIRWYWLNGMHTTTSDTIPPGAATWNHPIDINDTFFEYIPTVVGGYGYICNIHYLSNGMAGGYTVISTAGISNKNPEPAFSIYPNPVFSNLFVRVESTDSYIRDLKIYDLSGIMIREVNFTTSPGISDKTIDLSGLNPGIYLLEFVDNHDKQYCRKVTKL